MPWDYPPQYGPWHLWFAWHPARTRQHGWKSDTPDMHNTLRTDYDHEQAKVERLSDIPPRMYELNHMDLPESSEITQNGDNNMNRTADHPYPTKG